MRELGEDSDVIMGAKLNTFISAEDSDEKDEAAKVLVVLCRIFAPDGNAQKLFASTNHPEKVMYIPARGIVFFL